MIVLGIDPDLHSTALAGWDMKKRVVTFVGVIRVSEKLKGREAAVAMCQELAKYPLDDDVVVIEGQEIRYTARKGADPQDIVNLAVVAGGAASQAKGRVLMPSPSQWKGSIPKAVHQARVLGKLGWPSETVGRSTRAYTRPTGGFEGVLGAKDLGKEDWKHVVDAIGLAMWGGAK